MQTTRKVQADRYAPDEIKRARDALKAATREIDRQISRQLFFLRNYEKAIAMAEAARIGAGTAQTVAATKKLAIKRDTERLIAEADATVNNLQDVVGTLPLDSSMRIRLTVAQMAVTEAQIAIKQENFAQAARRAYDAKSKIQEADAQLHKILQQYAEKARLKWKQWIDETVAWSARTKNHAVIIDKISRTCDLYYNGVLKKTYPIELGPNFMKDKLMAGDRATPEGRYRISGIKGSGSTKYYKALDLNYPNEEDWEQFRRMKREGKIPKRAGIGGLIEIHGTGGRGGDWTSGCIALTNSDIDDLFRYVGVGTPVTIVGYKGGDIANVLLKAGQRGGKKNGKG
jgi:lipoprotein-anchoring transpeptidase ErfK/SrfK